MNTDNSFTAGFSLVAGGPAHRLQEKLGLVGPGSLRAARRAVLSIVLTWGVLLVLSAVQGLAIGSTVKVPFLHDFSAYARFLVAIPMLILAEGLIEREMSAVAAHFYRSGLIAESDRPKYEAALERAKRMRDSTLAEAVILVLAGLSALLVLHEFPLGFSTWRSLVSDSGHTRTFAGWWYLVVGVALFEFLLWRWLWRLAIWYGFLWRMSRLDLRLIATHPDRAAGLGFVGDAQRFFWVVVSAFAFTAAGVLGDEIVYTGARLLDFKFVIAGYVVVVLAAFLLPLTMFSPAMTEAKRRSLHEYDALAVLHNRLFDEKWVQGRHGEGEVPLGAPEISSLADLAGACDVLYRMRPVPFDPADAVALGLAALVPLTPLVLTVLPAPKMFDMLLKMFLQCRSFPRGNPCPQSRWFDDHPRSRRRSRSRDPDSKRLESCAGWRSL